MNKFLKYILIVAGIILGLWFVGRVTNTFLMFTIPTPSNYPTIKQGELIFASNLVKPERFDMICFHTISPENKREVFLYRLCGIEGDKLEIKEGRLYVNDQFVDHKLSISHAYYVSIDEFERVDKIEKFNQSIYFQTAMDSIMIFVPESTVAKHSINARQYIQPKDHVDESISNLYSAQWNQDNFGPVVVPQGKYFVLGDNRLNALDSRYIGFVDKSDYVATVLGKQ